MAEDMKLLLRIQADLNQAAREIRGLRGDVKGLGASGETASAGIGRVGRAAEHTSGLLREMRQQLVGLFAIGEIVRFGEEIVHTEVEMQRIHYTLESVTGSSAAAGREFKFISDTSQRLGLDLQTTAQGYSRLAVSAKSAGITTRQMHQAFLGLADTFTVLHTPAEDVQGLLVQLEQGMSLGKLQMQDFRAIAQHLPGTFELAKEAAQKMGGSLEKMLSQGGVPAKEFFQEFTALLRDKYGPEAVKAAHSVNAELNRMHTAFFQLRLQLGQGGFIDGVIAAAQALSQLSRAWIQSSKQAEQAKADYSGLGKVIRVGLGGPLGLIRMLLKEIADYEAGVAAGIATLITSIANHNFSGLVSREQAVLHGVLGSMKKDFAEYTDLLDKLQNPPKLAAPAAPSGKEEAAGKAAAAKFLEKHPGQSAGSGTAGAHQTQIQSIVSALQREAATYGMTSDQIKLYKLQQLGATQADIKAARTAEETVAQKKKQAQATKDAEKAQAQADKERRKILDKLHPERVHQREISQAKKTAQHLEKLGKLSKAQGDAWVKMVAEGKKATGQLDQFVVQAARNMEQSFSSFFFDAMQGKFDNLAASFKRTLDRMVADALAAKLGNKLFGQGFASGKSPNMGGLIGKGMNYLSGLFHEGGIVGQAPPASRLVPSALFLDAPRLHAGGAVLQPGEVPAILQTGEQVLSRQQVRDGAGKRPVVVNNHFTIHTPTGQVSRDTQSQIAARTGQAVNRALGRNR
ncbi:MAG TPA: tape measure protein [Gammaproteobacteria bacterium]|nr:tape measure protein [Gammaproteobacteria bacterium]